MAQRRQDEGGHHRVHVGWAADDPDVGKLGLLFGRKVREDARAQLLRRERRAQQLDQCEQWVGHHCVPAGYTVKLDDVETGLLFQLAADAAVEIDAAIDEVVTVERTARARSMSTGATTPAAPAISP
jgi:hypothetical protein